MADDFLVGVGEFGQQSIASDFEWGVLLDLDLPIAVVTGIAKFGEAHRWVVVVAAAADGGLMGSHSTSQEHTIPSSDQHKDSERALDS